jgi:hypothetical protein
VTSADVALQPITLELLDGNDRKRASVDHSHASYFWHTFDDCGRCGEFDQCSSLDEAKRQAIASIVMQGWAPGGWRVQW